MRRRILRALGRLMAAAALAVVITLLPQPGSLPSWLEAVWMPVVIFLLLCYTGKLLYDTLFYDHYRP